MLAYISAYSQPQGPIAPSIDARDKPLYGVNPTGNLTRLACDTNGLLLNADDSLYTTAIAASVSTDTVVRAYGPGRLVSVLVTTLGTNAMVIWDNASGHTGTIIGVVPASAAVGSLYLFRTPYTRGITVQGNAANPAVTLGFS